MSSSILPVRMSAAFAGPMKRKKRSATAAFSVRGMSSMRSQSSNINQKCLSRRPRSVFTANAATKRSPNRQRAGDNFLAGVCKEWEAESRRAEDAGIRTVLLRTGIVLSKDGGALATMLTPFKLGVGGVVGSGKQWMSWISLDDEIAIINYVIENENIRGAVNAVSPNPVTNHDFTKTLGDVLYRPTFLPLPEFAVSHDLRRNGRCTAARQHKSDAQTARRCWI